MDDKQCADWRRRVLLFLTSQCITLFGSTLVQMALVWYAAMETASGGWVAAFSVCAYLPQFLISFLGGVWADRSPRKALIMGADLLIALATLAMVLAIPHISPGTPLLFGLLGMSVIRSLGAGVQTPAVNAVIPQLVPEEHLMRCNGLNAAMQSMVNFAAPAAAGAVFAVSSLRTTLMIDLVTAVMGNLLLACLTLPGQRNMGRRIIGEKKDFRLEMKKGIKYTFSDRLLRKLLLLYGILTFCCVPAGYLSGLFVRREFGGTYWYLTAAEVVGFAGMTAGGIVMGVWGGLKRRELTFAAGLFAFGLLGAGMGLSGNFALYLGLMFCYGIALTMAQTALTTMVQEQAEPSMQGRVFGLMGTMYAGFLPLGMAVFGPLADVISLRRLMVGAGLALVAIAAAAGFFRKIRPTSQSGGA